MVKLKLLFRYKGVFDDMKHKKRVMVVVALLCLSFFSTSLLASHFPYNIVVNGKPVSLNHVILKDGRTYVQLRELAKPLNLELLWVGFHSAPVPGGNALEGVNINQSNVLNTRDISGLFDGQKTIGVEMTSLIKRYNEKRAEKLSYYFKMGEESGLFIKEGDKTHFIPITFYHYMGLDYVTAGEFKTKVQPYFLDLCLQA